MKKVLALAALIGLATLANGCVTTDAYDGLGSRVQKEQELSQALKDELVERERQIADLQQANADLAEEARKVTLVEHTKNVPVADTSISDELAELRRAIGQSTSEWDIITSDHAMGIRLDDNKDVLFDSGKWVLRDSAKGTLDRLATKLKEVLRDNPSYIVAVDGHTDSDPIKKAKVEDNTELAFRRAVEVKRYLATKGIDENKMYVRAFGEFWPVGENKKQCRRVELWVSNPAGFSVGNRTKSASPAKAPKATTSK